MLFRSAKKPHVPATELNMIPIAWTFAQWGLDMVGPLPRSAHGNHTYLLVVVDKFTKWIEAVPVTNQGATTAVIFFKMITCRFGIPHSIITDNGSNFTSKEFMGSARKEGSTSALHPLLICKQTAKSKKPMVSYVMASLTSSTENARFGHRSSEIWP